MGFFDDKLGPMEPVQSQSAAPGSWWQTPAQRTGQITGAPMSPVMYQQGQEHESHESEYRPRNSAFVKSRSNTDVDDTCPRCGSYEYVKIAAEPAQGTTYRYAGATVRCLACNYPAIDTSEGVIGSLTGTAAAVPVGGDTTITTYKVRERGGRNQNSFAGFNESSQAEGSHVMRIL
jgi:hypothetical protein